MLDKSMPAGEPDRGPDLRSASADRSRDPAFPLHHGGKIEVRPTVRIRDNEGLSLAYTPGVARVSQAIANDPALAYDYTWKGNTVLVVTDGTAVLGLGNIGPMAALPVMEGKALLFKEFANVDAIPVALTCTDVAEVVETVVRIAPAFGGVNLEDIAAPRCFEIERLLQERLDIPVFHDDQHGTAIVVTAALMNAAQVTGRSLADLRAVVSGAGAAGVAVTNMLLDSGIGDIAAVDSRGLVTSDRADLNPVKAGLAARTNRAGIRGGIADAMRGADVFIGVSAGRVPESVVATMADDAIVFALANPEPEVVPGVAERHAAVVATGRSDFPNQINNVLAFPGVFRGALDVRATCITPRMKVAAAEAIAGVVGSDLSSTMIVPSPFNPRVAVEVAGRVAAAARADGVART